MILVIGNINYDILFPLPRLPHAHEKMVCDDARPGFGGSAANTAYWLAGLGVEVVLSGSVGDDELGKGHLDQLEKAGVQTRGIRKVDAATGIAVIFSLGREKRMVRAPGANLEGHVDAGLLEGCGLVYLSGNDTRTLAGYAAIAKGRGIRVISGAHGAGEREIAKAADGYIMNSDELRLITGLDDPLEGLSALDSDTSAVTLPDGSCVVSMGIEIVDIPGVELDPVDRTGGG
ncbi:MAG: PfkB family carbohydrate kinase, partial [Pseudomonadota bacterium]